MANEDAEVRSFYDRAYAHPSGDVYLEIRREAFGEEIGQNSWVTADEYRGFLDRLGIAEGCRVLDIASGSGGPALFVAQETGCEISGLELHQAGVDAANARAAELGLAGRVRFQCADAREPLRFEDCFFDAVLCLDSLNHLYERGRVFAEWFRVLRPGGRLFVTDPITVTGMLRREEILAGSPSMGEFVFTPPGVDERLLAEAGFVDVEVEDATQNMQVVAARWHAARERHRAELDELEGAEANAAFQRFLAMVELLARERRLSRLAYLATKPA